MVIIKVTPAKTQSQIYLTKKPPIRGLGINRKGDTP